MRIASIAVLTLLLCVPVRAQSPTPVQAQSQSTKRLKPLPNPEAGLLRKVAFDQNLGAQIPLDLTFKDESGRSVQLKDYMGKKPLVLTLVYFECPMLCTLELNGLVRSLLPLSFDVGKEFDVLTVSIDPVETPELAKRKKASYLKRYHREGAEQGWHFLTGNKASISKLAGAAGFQFVYDPKSKQFAHPAGIVILTPEGKINRYFFGVDYPPRDLKLSLMEASDHKIGTFTDQLLLYCFHYDPSTGKYNFAIMSTLRILGFLTMSSLGFYMLVMFRRDWRRKREAMIGAGGAPAGSTNAAS